MPTKTQVVYLRSIGVRAAHIREMDPEIVITVIDLNRNGFHTMESCAGHDGKRGLMTIWPFPKGANYTRAVSILKRNGLKNIRKEYNWNKVPFITFTGIGKSRG